MESADSEGATNNSTAPISRVEPDDSEATSSNGPKRKMTPEPSPRKRRRERCIESPHFTAENYELWKNCGTWKEETKKVVEEVLKKLEEVNSIGSDEEELLHSLKKKTQQLKEKCLLENICIGVFGQTGAGKSSLVNAVLEEESLLPTSAIGACTSAIIKVQSDRGRKFKAEIEFLTEKEWNEELKVLVELCEENRDDDDDGDDEEDEESKDVEMAKQKLIMMYGDCGPLKSYEELVKMNIYQDVPKNSRKVLSEENAQALSSKLDPYIRSKTRQTDKIYWPLVKSVSVYIPRSQVLPEGVVLIDFPGSGDSNKTRDEMWKEELINCSSVWIVSRISRSIDEKIGAEIFGTSIKAARNGGRCHDIAFICTQTDDIHPHEYIREQGFTDEAMNISIEDDLMDSSRKKKRFCMLHRNQTVKKEMVKQYGENWKKQMKNKSAELEFSKDDLHVYTVSSREYWEFRRQSNSCISETEIPNLQKHIINMYLKERKKIVNNYVSEVWGMLLLLTSLNCSQHKQNVILRSKFDTISKDLKKALGDFTEHLESCAKNLQGNLNQGTRDAEKKCLKVIKKHAELPGTKSFQGYHRTLKAICRNHGAYNSARFGPINVNSDLSKCLYQEIDTFCETTLQFNKGRRASMKGQLNRIKLSLTNVIDEPLPTKSTGENAWVWKCRQDFMKTELNALLSDLQRQIIEKKKHIYKAAILSVQQSMKPAYEEAAQKKGAKILPSMQRILIEHVQQQKDKLFRDAAASVMEQFDKMKVCLKEEMDRRLTITLKLGFSQWPGRNPLPDFENEFNQINPIWDQVKKI
ncbi:nuclear GTPase SLIP-GC-like [Heterodontus francisci]|uniref:nuclear GTPase SLIP-GC-like n=1 Tax=Heterodontus francisci TaxID=7792 RepID=UPI00355B890B